jgi:hypothetical protein
MIWIKVAVIVSLIILAGWWMKITATQLSDNGDELDEHGYKS